MSLETLSPKLYQTFQTIIQTQRLSHAYLFSGAFASFEMAIYLAQSRFCTDLQDHLPCGHCRPCHLIEAGQFSDVTVVEPSGQLIKTETVRDLVKDFSRSGYESKSQVFIIREADKMHPNAANSLLKVIEEPQSQVYVILLTKDVSKMLPTIVSRCQVFHFPKNRSYLVDQLKEDELLPSQAELVADLADGLEEARSLVKQSKVLEVIKPSQQFLEAWLAGRMQVHLEGTGLANLLPDKADQSLWFDLASQLLLAQGKTRRVALALSNLHQVRQMWQSNVSFQNCLDYLVILPLKDK